MAMLLGPLLLLLFVALSSHIADHVASATNLIIYNKCPYTVWPGIQPGAGNPVLAGGGFKLPPSRARKVNLPPLWSGRVWGRHECAFDGSGRGSCSTGDCGGNLLCAGIGGTPPATLAEITLTAAQDFYDVSLVDGYNIPISVVPLRGGSGKCGYAGCVSDLNQMCPEGLQVRSGDGRRVLACKSACAAFNSEKFCCTGSYGSPQSCKPTAYSRVFKAACPRAYSYAYDDPSSLTTCTGTSYVVTFCPRHRR